MVVSLVSDKVSLDLWFCQSRVTKCHSKTYFRSDQGFALDPKAKAEDQENKEIKKNKDQVLGGDTHTRKPRSGRRFAGRLMPR